MEVGQRPPSTTVQCMTSATLALAFSRSPTGSQTDRQTEKREEAVTLFRFDVGSFVLSTGVAQQQATLEEE